LKWRKEIRKVTEKKMNVCYIYSCKETIITFNRLPISEFKSTSTLGSAKFEIYKKRPDNNNEGQINKPGPFKNNVDTESEAKKRNNSAERDRCEHPKKRPRTRVAKNLENSINNSRELINIAKEKLVIKKGLLWRKITSA
jgi:hypothetical protein